jgi:ABC-type uncharacterized transport system permease subunit
MGTTSTLIGLAGVIAAATPVLFAVLGETITERSGIINLSLNGSILLSAMGGFAVAYSTDSLLLGFLGGMALGALMAFIVAYSSISLRQSQVAVGFVLALLGRDLSYFLGVPYMNFPGPSLPGLSVPLLKDIPILGPLFFRQNLMTYLSFALILLVWVWLYRTRPGLMLRGIGERPAAAFVRGANVNRLRYTYTLLGGALTGLAGPAYTLNVKAGWMGTQTGLDGVGWIALAITIFGAWDPIRGAFGVYLFALLQWLGIVLQSSLPGVPSQVLQVAPFPLMILALLLVNIGSTEWVARTLAALPDSTRLFITRVLRSLRASPPAALGLPFEQE